MAIPSNILVTPNESTDIELPRTINVTGDNIFERPSYDVRELFTQSGTRSNIFYQGFTIINPDTGSVGYSATPSSNPNPLADVTNQLPDITNANSFGVSLRVKIPSSNPAGVLINITTVNSNTAGFSMEWSDTNKRFYIKYSSIDSSGLRQTDFWSPTLNYDIWYHIFIFAEDLFSQNFPLIYVDNILYDTSSFGGTVQNFENGMQSLSRATIGATDEFQNQPFTGEVSDIYISTNENFKDYVGNYYNNLPPTITDTNLITFTDLNVGDAPIDDYDNAIISDGIIGSAVTPNGIGKIDTLLETSQSGCIGISFWYYHVETDSNKILLNLYDNLYGYDSLILRLETDNTLLCSCHQYNSTKRTEFKLANSNLINNNWNHIFLWFNVWYGPDEDRFDIRVNNNPVYQATKTLELWPENIAANTHVTIGGKRDDLFLTGHGSISGKICNLYISRQFSFKNYINEYSNLPTVEINNV